MLYIWTAPKYGRLGKDENVALCGNGVNETSLLVFIKVLIHFLFIFRNYYHSCYSLPNVDPTRNAPNLVDRKSIYFLAVRNNNVVIISVLQKKSLDYLYPLRPINW